MSEIEEIWSSFDGSTSGEQENIPKRILEMEADAINKDTERSEIFASVVSVTGTEINELKHVLYLLPVYGNGYNYRFIEFIQPIDDFFPVKISAFQSGNTDFGYVTFDQGTQGIYEVLRRIYTDLRTKVVFTQLKAMGATIKGWKDETEQK